MVKHLQTLQQRQELMLLRLLLKKLYKKELAEKFEGQIEYLGEIFVSSKIILIS